MFYSICFIIVNLLFVSDYVASNSTQSITVNAVTFPVKSVFGWMVILEKSMDTNWYDTWAAYKAGFGTVGGQYFMGLENIHLLTANDDYVLRVEILQLISYDWYSAEYWHFTVGDEASTQYTLNVGG